MDTFLVTGASGMLGRHLVRCLLDLNALVRVLVRPSSNVAFLGGQKVQIVTGEAGDSKAIAATLHLDMSRAEGELGFRPRYSLVEGLAATLEET